MSSEIELSGAELSPELLKVIAATNGADPLGFLEHDNINGERARIVVGSLDAVVSAALRNNSEVRSGLLDGGDYISLPEASYSDVHRMRAGVQVSDDGGLVYSLLRTDEGSAHGNVGGFYAIHRSDGSCILRTDLCSAVDQADINGDDIYSWAIQMTAIYAKKLSAQLPMRMGVASTRELLSNEDIAQYRKQAAKEASFLHRATTKAGYAARYLGDLLLKKTDNRAGVQTRRWSPAKVALAAMLLPVPGYGEDIPGPVPRPVGAEIAADTFGFGADAYRAATGMFIDEAEALSRAYDDRSLNLGSDVWVPESGEPIALPTVAPFAPALGVDRLVIDGSKDALEGLSPRSVDLSGSELGINECEAVPISSTVVSRRLVLASTNSAANIGEVTIRRTQGSLVICNEGEVSVDLDDLDLIFDAE